MEPVDGNEEKLRPPGSLGSMLPRLPSLLGVSLVGHGHGLLLGWGWRVRWGWAEGQMKRKFIPRTSVSLPASSGATALSPVVCNGRLHPSQ